MGNISPFLILRLEGMLQSWGDHAKWDTRETSDFPSKSGIVGLLGCAMGLERDNPELAELSRNIRIAARADHPGVRTMDFHTVQGRPLYTADGGKRAPSASTIVSKRWYLQDASFLVVIETTKPWLDRICAALKHPVWPIYLGRKSCVPSRPVLEAITTEYTTIMDAICRYPVSPCVNAISPVGMAYECEGAHTGNSSYSRPDDLLASDRSFGLRTVYRGVISEEVPYVSD